MQNNEVDRRIGKTRQVLHEAMFSLMQEKLYSKITIKDIIDRANVGRSTFYSHYETKDDLLLSCIEHLLEMLNLYIINYLEIKEDSPPRLITVVELFDHLKENSRIIKGLMKAESADVFFDKVQVFWNKKIEEYLQSKLPKDIEYTVPLVILSNHITSTLINLIKWWMSNKMFYTSSQMDQYFQELINPCIDSIIGKKV